MEGPTRLRPGPPRRQRYKVRLRAEIFFKTPSGQESVSGQGFNVSEGGMAMFAPVELKVGTVLRVDLTIPISGEILPFNAVIRNRDSFPGVYGIAFTDSSDEQKKRLAKYCAAMALVAETC